MIDRQRREGSSRGDRRRLYVDRVMNESVEVYYDFAFSTVRLSPLDESEPTDPFFFPTAMFSRTRVLWLIMRDDDLSEIESRTERR